MGDVENGTKLFERYGEVDDKWLQFRKIVVDRRQPRRLFVQPNTVRKENGKHVYLNKSGLTFLFRIVLYKNENSITVND